MNLFTLLEPKKKTNNIIYNSPHSGEKFPKDFFDTIAIDKGILLSSGDSFVDQLFEEACQNGSVLMSNVFSRSYVDTNREAFELDPNMFSGEITETLNDKSAKVRMGFGSIAKYAFTRQKIYKEKIPFPLAIKRLEDYYFPIHNQLNNLLTADFDHFGYSLLIDCHSMPSYEFLGQLSHTSLQPDIIIGDRFGRSCHPAVTDYLMTYFQDNDFNVANNLPFAGGFNTVNYGEPEKKHHAVQIEIKKSLYMDEVSRMPNENFNRLRKIMGVLSCQLNNDIMTLVS